MVNHEDLLKSAEELCRKAENHRRLMRGARDGTESGSHGFSCEQNTMKLRQAICESISVIEETRKSFKSKRLEMLRKKLIQTLADE
jgi:hypothetical protein